MKQPRDNSEHEKGEDRNNQENAFHSPLTKKAEPPPTRGVNRVGGTDSANGGWLRRLVKRNHREKVRIRYVKAPTPNPMKIENISALTSNQAFHLGASCVSRPDASHKRIMG